MNWKNRLQGESGIDQCITGTLWADSMNLQQRMENSTDSNPALPINRIFCPKWPHGNSAASKKLQTILLIGGLFAHYPINVHSKHPRLATNKKGGSPPYQPQLFRTNIPCKAYKASSGLGPPCPIQAANGGWLTRHHPINLHTMTCLKVFPMLNVVAQVQIPST